MNDTETPASPTRDHSWPVLRASDPDPCDGQHPETGQPCVLRWHSGYHRDATGVEWLDK